MKKKIIAAVVCMAAVFSLVGCGKEETASNGSVSEPSSVSDYSLSEQPASSSTQISSSSKKSQTSSTTSSSKSSSTVSSNSTISSTSAVQSTASSSNSPAASQSSTSSSSKPSSQTKSSVPVSTTPPQSSAPVKPEDPNIVVIEEWGRYKEFPIDTTTDFNMPVAITLNDKNVKQISRLVNLEILDHVMFSKDASYDVLVPLGNLKKLKKLYLNHTASSNDEKHYNFSFLSELTDLEQVWISYHMSSKIPDLSQLKKLQELNIAFCKIDDISGLSNLKSLTSLDLTCDDLSDISPISGLTNLTELDLSGNPEIKDLSPLAPLTKLERLNLQGIEINNVEPLLSLSNLKYCYLDFDKISKENLTNLQLALPNCKFYTIGMSS